MCENVIKKNKKIKRLFLREEREGWWLVVVVDEGVSE